MFSLGSAQAVVFFALGVLAFVVQLYALVDGARRRPDAYVAAGKQTKQRWMIILGVAAAIGFISFNGAFLGPLNFLNIIAFVAAAVYLADVRPALKQVQGGGRGGASGPYGPW
jgi:ABC-type Na+ efflux pump permease subunit